MTTPKFTPGPWTAETGENVIFIYGPDSDIPSIAHLGRRDMDHDNAANARLIASAPDLYAALERLLANAIAKERLINLMEWQHLRVPEPDEVDFSPEMKAARAALAKASGMKGGE